MKYIVIYNGAGGVKTQSFSLIKSYFESGD